MEVTPADSGGGYAQDNISLQGSMASNATRQSATQKAHAQIAMLKVPTAFDLYIQAFPVVLTANKP